MTVNFAKGLVPAVIQDAETLAVLMVGYMNEEALRVTRETGRVTFYSRSKERLWTKGESSGNFLNVKSIREDCDEDALLILAQPLGPTCHNGTKSCFDGGAETAPETQEGPLDFVLQLESLLQRRRKELPEGSYSTKLFKKGRKKIAQKLGEEAVEVILEIDNEKERFTDEAADLVFHLLVLLADRDSSLGDVVKVLKDRHRFE